MKLVESKIGLYSILVNDENDKIYFYPEYALNEEEVDYLKNALAIVFEFNETRNNDVFKVNAYLQNRDEEIVFKTYSIYMFKIDAFKYGIIDNYGSNEDFILGEKIDFVNMGYQDFIRLIANNNELNKMIPELKNQIEISKENLSYEKEMIKVIEIPSMINYFQNMSGYLINEIEKIITTEDEISISKEILKNVKKSHSLVLRQKQIIDLTYLNLYSIILNNVKTSNIEPKSILETKELKCDTNKTILKYKDLNDILEHFINEDNNDTPEDLNIIQERIEYNLKTKPKVLEFSNHIKIILSTDDYIDDSKRVRAVDECKLKEILIKCFNNNTYRPLPRNLVLLYDFVDDSNLNFCAILSNDMVLKLFKTYSYNNSDENKKYIDILKDLDNYICKGKFKDDINYLNCLLYAYLIIYIYYYKNIGDNLLLFNKGNNIINLDFKNGGYDISIVNKVNGKLNGKLTKIDDDTRLVIKDSLDKSEKAFNTVINDIIFKNIIDQVKNLKVNIEINDVSHNGINVMFDRTLKKNIFRGKFSLEELLLSLSQIKVKKEDIKKDEVFSMDQEDFEVKDEYVCGILKSDYDYIIRKSNTINDIVSQGSIKDKKYLNISTLYKKFIKSNSDEYKHTILIEMSELLDLENITKKED